MKLQQQIIDRWERLEPVKKPDSYLPRTVEATAIVAPGTVGARASTRMRFLSAEGQRPTTLEQEVIRGTNDLLEVNFLDRCLLVCQAIGRIEATGPQGRVRATGFMIAPGLIMTNHHVLLEESIAATGSIEFGYRYNVAGEIGQTTRFALDPGTFFAADKGLDYAVVAVQPESLTGRESIDGVGYLRLYPESGKVRLEEFVTIIQHPDGLPMQIALRENQVTRFNEDEPFIQYEADTAHGSSGAPVFNDSLQIAALHSGGRIKRAPTGEYVLRDGESTSSLAGRKESDFVWEANAGIRISRICADLLKRARAKYPTYVLLLQRAMAGGDLLARSVVAARTGTDVPLVPPAPSSRHRPRIDRMQPEATSADTRDEHRSRPALVPVEPDGRGVMLPLALCVTLEDPHAVTPLALRARVAPGARTLVSLLESEAFPMQIPVIYDRLAERTGYDPDFLELGNGARYASICSLKRAMVSSKLSICPNSSVSTKQ